MIQFVLIMKMQSSQKQADAVRHIRNWIMHKGKTPSVRELMTALEYKSPRSAALIIDELIQKGILRKRANGDLILVRQQSAAQNGDIVVALIDDEATVKEFRHHKNCVVLMPRSNNKNHKPIILTENFQVQGVAVTTIPKLEV